MLNLRLCALRDETAHIRVFVFCDAAGGALPAYSAGAHLDFDLGAAGIRSYSLIDWPQGGDGYQIAVQREDAGQGGSQAMHQLQVGDTVLATAPKNDFELKDGGSPVMLLAGGIGITPLISMATELLGQGRDFRFVYRARTATVAGFSADLQQRFPDQISVHYDDDDPVDLGGLMDAASPDTQLYICGPKGMIDAARTVAETAGLTDIHVELFSSPQPDGGDAPFEVEINDGRVFVIPAGRSIVDVLEEAGVDVMYDCQRGDCGICQTDVIQGTPDHRDVVLSDTERAAGKVMQICVSRAKSDRLVLDL